MGLGKMGFGEMGIGEMGGNHRIYPTGRLSVRFENLKNVETPANPLSTQSQH